jgi:hypothetical protein
MRGMIEVSTTRRFCKPCMHSWSSTTAQLLSAGPLRRCTHNIHSFLWAPLQAGGSLLRREYALVYRAGLLNKTGPVEVALRNKLCNFAHLLTTVGNSEEIFRQQSPVPATIGF